jgi:dihydroorotate dehydrogenase
MNLTRSVLHRFDPEWVHDLAVTIGVLLGRHEAPLRFLEFLYSFADTRFKVRIGNLDFPNPIGLAAGFDKNGVIIPVLQALGFGFIEVGTVTPLPQVGNDKPRLFRLLAEEGIINRMGFNNRGIDSLVSALKQVERKVPIGVNLGKNKVTPNECAAEDYKISMQKSWSVADYFTINISSPNTENLRDLQGEAYLQPLLDAIVTERNRLAAESRLFKQIWLKIAPDLSDRAIDLLCDTMVSSGFDALVISNTTVSRNNLAAHWQKQAGGLSGRPLYELSNRVLDKANRKLKGKLPIVGVGGVFSYRDVLEKMSLGASLVQIYTSLVFSGPGIVKKLKKGLVTKL